MDEIKHICFHYYVNMGFTPVRIDDKKRPLDLNWNTPSQEIEYDPNQLYGFMPPPDCITIDVDVKNNQPGLESFRKFISDNPTLPQELSEAPEKYYSVRTPSGGFHFYIQLSPDLDYSSIPKHHENYPGLEFMRRGKEQTVGAGQVLSNGVYVAKEMEIYGLITSLDCFKVSQPYLDPDRYKKGAKKITQEVFDISASDQFTTEQLRSLLSYISSDHYNDWYKVAWILMNTQLPEGTQKELWKEWSSKSDKFKEGASDSKWRSLYNDFGKHDATLQTLGTLVWMARNQHKDDPAALHEINNILHKNDIDSLRGRICRVQSVVSSVHYYDLKLHAWYNECGAIKTLKPLLDAYSDSQDEKPIKKPRTSSQPKEQPKPKKATLQTLINSGDIPIPIDKVYLPGKPTPLFHDDYGRLYLNEYSTHSIPSPINYTHSDIVDFYFQHAQQILGEKYVHDYLSFIAYLAQNPGEKIRWMLVLEGGKGTGKGLLLQAVKNHVLGIDNCRGVNTNEILSEHNSWAFGAQLVHIDELMIKGRGADRYMNTLKTLITDDKATRREKYIVPSEIPCCASFIALTNFKNSLKYADSRRYHAIISPIRTPDDIKLESFKTHVEYYNHLAYIASHDNPRGGELRRFFLDYKIPSTFSAAHRPNQSDFDKFQDESNKISEYEDYYDLIYYLAQTETLPPYINIHEVCRHSQDINPSTQAPFFDAPLTPKLIKKFGKHISYSPFSGWLISDELNPDKAKTQVRIFRNLKPSRYPTDDQGSALTTKEAIEFLSKTS